MILNNISLAANQSGRAFVTKVALRRTARVLGLLGLSGATMGAQVISRFGSPFDGAAQPSQSDSRSSSSNVAVMAAGDSYSTSSYIHADAALTEARLSSAPAVPSGRISNGTAGQYNNNRPRYHYGGNDDGSSKWMFYAGAGLTAPIGNAKQYLTENFALQAGGGYNVTRHFSVPIEFDWAKFGLTKQNLNNQITIYDSILGPGAVDGMLDGNSHIWSFSVEPRYTFRSGSTWKPYVFGGVGFYHKVANFTVPSTGSCGYGYGYGYGYGGGCGNVNFDHYSSNAPGFDGGAAISYQLSNSRVSFYAEARYVFVDSSQQQGVTINNYTTASTAGADLYPANSNHTAYIPITFGVRF